MKEARAGGHEQGTWIGCPLDPLMAPSQFPLPLGLIPATQPRGAARDAISAAERPPAPPALDAAAAEVVAGAAAELVVTAGGAALEVVAGGAAEEEAGPTGGMESEAGRGSPLPTAAC